MADGVDFTLLGLDELQSKMRGVSEEVSQKATKTATERAARLVARAAHRGAMRIDDPQSRADITKNIWLGGAKYPGVSRNPKRFRPADGEKYRVGVLGGAGGNRKKNADYFDQFAGGDTRHWRFWEFGSENTKAVPFLRPALQGSINAAINLFMDEYEKAIDKASRAVAKRRGRRSGAQQARRNLFGLSD